MFERYKKQNVAIQNQDASDATETKTIRDLTNRLGYHLARVIRATETPEGWIAAYTSMNNPDWPHVFPRPLTYGDMVRSLEMMIEAFEPRALNAGEDAIVRELAERLLNWDQLIDYVFVAYREGGYEITVVSEGEALVREWPALSLEAVQERFQSEMPASFDVDDTYLGTGRDYGGWARRR